MSVNAMNFEQAGAFLGALYGQATGKEEISVANTGEFTSVATTLLQMGYDPVMEALSQVLGRTVFSIRPYSRKFKGLDWTEDRWGAITRKINFLDTELDSADDRLSLTDGASVDQQIVKKPKALETHFYGSTEYQDHITVFRDQLDMAFQSPSEFSRFITGVLQNITDRHTQIEESEARGLLANFIAAKAAADPGNVINVLSEYTAQTGVTLTPSTMFAVDNFSDFMRWLAGYLATLMDMMSQRSIKYHMNVAGKEVQRHTPAERMKKFISSNIANYLDATVGSDIYSPDRLNGVTNKTESVAYWQNIDEPYTVMAAPSYMNTAGEIVTGDSTTVSGIIGVLMDEDAAGMVKQSTWMANAPFNARGGYYNTFWHFRQRTMNDFTENFVVLVAR